MRSASAVPVPGRRHHQPGGAGIESQAPGSCEGSVAISASPLRTISSHHFNLHAAAAGCSARLRSPQHPRGSLPTGTGALTPALCASSAGPVSAGRGRAPHPSSLLGRRTRRGQPPGQGRGRQEPPPRGAEGAPGTGSSPRVSTREVAPALPGAAASSLRSRPPSLPPPSPPLHQNRRSRYRSASLAPVPAAERVEGSGAPARPGAGAAPHLPRRPPAMAGVAAQR